MFPDTSDDKQLAALRLAAERSRSNTSSQSELERSLLKALPPLREALGTEGSQAFDESAAEMGKLRLARG